MNRPMWLQWLAFFITTVIAYCGIAFFAQITGGSSTGAWQAITSVVRPLPLIIIVIANMFVSVGIYYGFGVTRYAIAVATAIGVVTTYVYSIVVLGAKLSALKLIGIAAILVGIVLLGM